MHEDVRPRDRSETLTSTGTGLIFAGGCPRSGLTLLRRLLAQHPGVLAGSDTAIAPSVAFQWRNFAQSLGTLHQEFFDLEPEAVSGIMGRFLEGSLRAENERRIIFEKTSINVAAFEALADMLPGVRSIIAVASGKGGVGKSTTAANLALGLAAEGHSVGLLDADIYGPSMPRMMGITGQPASADGKTLDPMENYGIKVMSMGFLVDEETPMIWRGPMVQSALEQMMRDVNWGELDVLVVDMPPGTGDAQLTMAQRVPLTGAVIVSTPQDIALLDARKGLNMFRKVDVPVFGIIENMSYFSCPHCGERSEIFSHGGARREAERLGVDFLGEVPLHIDIRTTADGGHPIVVSMPEGEHALKYREIARDVWARIEKATGADAKTGPKIVFQ